jgi:hypothetical protein
VRKESHRHPGHPVNPVKIPLRFISGNGEGNREQKKLCRKSAILVDSTAERRGERLPKLIGSSEISAIVTPESCLDPFNNK